MPVSAVPTVMQLGRRSPSVFADARDTHQPAALPTRISSELFVSELEKIVRGVIAGQVKACRVQIESNVETIVTRFRIQISNNLASGILDVRVHPCLRGILPVEMRWALRVDSNTVRMGFAVPSLEHRGRRHEMIDRVMTVTELVACRSSA